MKKIIILLLMPLFLFSCFGKNSEESKKGAQTKTLQEYKKVWTDSFKYYQTNVKEIKKSGLFDFEFTVMVAGNKENLMKKFSNIDLNGELKALSIKLDGDYDFLDKNNPKLNGNIRAYLNKNNFGLGDMDISFNLENKSTLKYTINNLDGNFLKFFLTDKDQIDALLLEFTHNSGKELTFNIPQEIVDGLFLEAKNIDLEKNLYENTKEEEKKIIESFLNNEVIEILSGETLEGFDMLNFKFNGDNFIKFLNEVGKIIGKGNEEKNFNGDKELFKNIGINGELKIQNNEIKDSIIKTEIILKGLSNSGTKVEDKLKFDTKLKMVDYKNLNIDFDTLISSDSTPDNKIQIKLKGLIK